MPAVSAGRYDRRVWIEHRVAVADPLYNADDFAWVKSVEVYARKKESSVPPTSNDGDPGLTTYQRPTKVWIRWREFDKVTMRLCFVTPGQADRILRVTGTAELGRKDELELACEEWVHTGASQ